MVVRHRKGEEDAFDVSEPFAAVAVAAPPLFPPARGAPRVPLELAYFGAPAAALSSLMGEGGNWGKGGVEISAASASIAESGASRPSPAFETPALIVLGSSILTRENVTFYDFRDGGSIAYRIVILVLWAYSPSTRIRWALSYEL